MTFPLARLGSPMQPLLFLDSKKRLELNLTASFLHIAMSSAKLWRRESQSVLYWKRGVVAPYVIKNYTGYSLKLWAEMENGSHGEKYHNLAESHQTNPAQFPFRQPITKKSTYAREAVST